MSQWKLYNRIPLKSFFMFDFYSCLLLKCQPTLQMALSPQTPLAASVHWWFAWWKHQCFHMFGVKNENQHGNPLNPPHSRGNTNFVWQLILCQGNYFYCFPWVSKSLYKILHFTLNELPSVMILRKKKTGYFLKFENKIHPWFLINITSLQ